MRTSAGTIFMTLLKCVADLSPLEFCNILFPCSY